MADLSVQKIDASGIIPTFVAAGASGDTFANDGRTFLHVKNGGASSITVTIDSKKPCDQGFDHDLTITIPAGGERLIGPFSPDRFNDAVTKKTSVSYSSVTSVTVAALKL